MPIDTWLLQYAAELAEQAAAHLAAATAGVQHETHLLLEEITGLGHAGGASLNGAPPIDGGCAFNN
jgi:hypothetical protein